MGPDMRLHASRAFGGLLSVHMLDGRQYRSPAVCPRPGRRGANRVRAEACPELFDPSRSMFGLRQERWLDATLAADTARWTLLPQGVLMAQADEDDEPGPRYYTDSWNGYPMARNRLMDMLVERRTANPVVISGDIHVFIAADLRQRGDDGRTPVVASELVTTSISSRGAPQDLLETMKRNTPDLHFAEGRHRGYLQLDLSMERLEARMLGVVDTANASSAVQVIRQYVVEAGRRGLQSG
jgi:alkaline phosphatase D